MTIVFPFVESTNGSIFSERIVGVWEKSEKSNQAMMAISPHIMNANACFWKNQSEVSEEFCIKNYEKRYFWILYSKKEENTIFLPIRKIYSLTCLSELASACYG